LPETRGAFLLVAAFPNLFVVDRHFDEIDDDWEVRRGCDPMPSP
jgi:hypothetical protein